MDVDVCVYVSVCVIVVHKIGYNEVYGYNF